jgi:hypothetical protein
VTRGFAQAVGSTAIVCSVITLVGVPAMVISGRNDAGLEPVDVGAMSSVDNRRSSDCTTTA